MVYFRTRLSISRDEELHFLFQKRRSRLHSRIKNGGFGYVIVRTLSIITPRFSSVKIVAVR